MLEDFEDESLSEGSVGSNGDEERDLEGSDSSGDERGPAQPAVATSKSAAEQGPKQPSPNVSTEDATSSHVEAFKTTTDTEAMLHGATPGQQPQETEELLFDELLVAADAAAAQPAIEPPKAPRNENPAQRARREHQEYIRQRNADPAFVPNRGGFFLHDDRTSSSIALPARLFGRGRGRGYGPPISTG